MKRKNSGRKETFSHDSAVLLDDLVCGQALDPLGRCVLVIELVEGEVSEHRHGGE